MKILMINVSCGIESTGRICTDLAMELKKQGHIVKIAYGRGIVPEQYQDFAIRVGNDIDVYMHALRARLFDEMGFGSVRVTKRFIKWIEEYDPDIIHLHNLHGYYINIKILFEYLQNSRAKIIWTLHDCWSFTGHCAYFDYVGCDKWKNECKKCSQRKEYPKRWIIDHSKQNYELKKRLFTNIKDLIFVTPSYWLAGLLKESFLSEYPVKVIHNGIDTSIFKPTQSNIKEQLGIKDKKIVLGVASVWDRRKGLDTFLELAKKIDDSYKIVLVGLNETQIKNLPSNIIGIQRTNNIQELVELYSAADMFVNPTLEDNYPTTNLEAIACGTPVITFNTGGSPEAINSENGHIVDQGKLNDIIKLLLEDKKQRNRNKIRNSNPKLDKKNITEQYMRIYYELKEN